MNIKLNQAFVDAIHKRPMSENDKRDIERFASWVQTLEERDVMRILAEYFFMIYGTSGRTPQGIC